MKAHHHGHEHELEPEYGLPERLPMAEQIIWQGSPHWPDIFRQVFHARGLVAYFSLVALVQILFHYDAAQGWSSAMGQASWVVMPATLAIALFGAMAWLVAKTTVYTITTKRVILRIGIVLNVTFNLPFKRIASADIRLRPSGLGDIALQLVDDDKIAFMHLWPHAKPWAFKQPIPMMRCIPAAARVGELLRQACEAHLGQRLPEQSHPAVAVASRHDRSLGQEMAQS
ncbi:MAG: photosynthetic complex putative assembly protein PuhB [Burkholderiaceae bacterium]